MFIVDNTGPEANVDNSCTWPSKTLCIIHPCPFIRGMKNLDREFAINPDTENIN